MKRLSPLVALVVTLPILVMLNASPADTSIPDNDSTTGVSKTTNSSASVAIEITMTELPSE